MEMSIGEKGFSLVLTIMQWASSLARPLALSMLLCAYQISSSLPVEGARAVGGGEVGASCRAPARGWASCASPEGCDNVIR